MCIHLFIEEAHVNVYSFGFHYKLYWWNIKAVLSIEIFLAIRTLTKKYKKVYWPKNIEILGKPSLEKNSILQKSFANGGVISFSYLYFFSKTVESALCGDHWNLRFAEIISWIGWGTTFDLRKAEISETH